MRNSIGADTIGGVGVTNSKGRLVRFVGQDYRLITLMIQENDVDDDGWTTAPLHKILIPGEFL